MNSLADQLKQRILVLDGGMGTMLQRMQGTEQDCVRRIHQLYIEAGADIISTHTFTANEGPELRERNLRFGRLAREVADACTDRKIYVAGSVGPTNHTLSMADDVTFDQLYRGYRQQMQALAECGVDAFLFETFFDTLNLKAALLAAIDAAPEIPRMISATLEKSGRLLSGQTIEAFVATVAPFHPLSIGFNCSFGARDLLNYVEQLAQCSPFYISVYPNAGLPNQLGEYDESPEMMAGFMRPYFERNLLNVVGGCCGTTPDHIREVAQLARQAQPHRLPQLQPASVLTGLEPMRFDHFVQGGERTNVAGSKKFARLIAAKDYDEALQVARKQVEGGAQVIDVCMDDALLDAKQCMAEFLHLAGADPYIARVPVMIDSSKWEVLQEGLKHTQGKPIVNSISLKEGEQVFLERAAYIQKYGAAVVVMAFDEEGQATTYERRVAVCTRAYRLLTEKLNFNPYDIVFDPNVLSIATGLPEHDNYAVDFIRTVSYIRQQLPGAHVSGGVSNLSFSFRGNNKVREAMHSVFLYHAIQAGLDMAIVNPEMLEIYDNIDPELREKIEAVVLNTHAGATEALIELANRIKAAAVPGAPADTKTDAWREEAVGKRLQYAILNGTAEYVEQDVNEALQHYAPLQIVEEVLMQGITKVGELFGEGKMFLPQVVKSAQVMQKAVSFVTPHLPAGHSDNRRKALLATVKGDVHDIGKNIVGVVMACNGYEVIDLGVMVPKEKIVEEALRQQVQAVCLSGLITPSLTEMVEVARALQQVGMDVPLMVGGATTSEKHTALFIDTAYDGPVAHTRDASAIVPVLGKLLTDGNYRMCLKAHYAKIRSEAASAPTMRQHSPVKIDWNTQKVYVPASTGRRELTPEIAQLLPLVNWKAFAFDWRVKDAAAEELVREGQAFLQEHLHEFVAKAVVGIYPVAAQGDTLLVEGHPLPMFRNGVCLTDFIAPQGDHLGLFAATVIAVALAESYKAENDLYHSLMTEFLANRLVEALSEWLHRQMRTEWWGFETGIRPAVGYSCLPDHRMKRDVFEILDAASHTGIQLTETGAMLPLSSVCGFYFACDKAVYY